MNLGKAASYSNLARGGLGVGVGTSNLDWDPGSLFWFPFSHAPL